MRDLWWQPFSSPSKQTGPETPLAIYSQLYLHLIPPAYLPKGEASVPLAH